MVSAAVQNSELATKRLVASLDMLLLLIRTMA
jgi:hypothetical protein